MERNRKKGKKREIREANDKKKKVKRKGKSKNPEKGLERESK